MTGFRLAAQGVSMSAVLEPPYRYLLGRSWDESLPRALFVGLNPSKASGDVEDHTTRKWRGFCDRMGCGSYEAVNLYAYVETDSSKLRALQAAGVDLIGPKNDSHIQQAAARAARVIFCWGNVPLLGQRAAEVTRIVKLAGCTPLCWGRTGGGAPRHPARIPYGTLLVPY